MKDLSKAKQKLINNLKGHINWLRKFGVEGFITPNRIDDYNTHILDLLDTYVIDMDELNHIK